MKFDRGRSEAVGYIAASKRQYLQSQPQLLAVEAQTHIGISVARTAGLAKQDVT